MKFSKVFGWTTLAISLVGGYSATTAKYAGNGVKNVSWALKNTFAVTEVIGKGVEEGSKYLETQFTNLNNYSKDYLSKEEYRDLKPFEFRGSQKDGWIIIDGFPTINL